MSWPTVLMAGGGAILTYFLQNSPYGVKTTTPQQQWADAPLKLVTTPFFETNQTDLFTSGATHMANVHNVMIRGFNSIYQQAPIITPEYYSDFVGYSKAWVDFVTSHHYSEEMDLFITVSGILDDEYIFEETHMEHESFIEGVERFEAYLYDLPSAKDMSSEKMLAIMDEFSKGFEAHMHSEVKTIAALAKHRNAPVPGTRKAAEATSVFKTWGKKSITKSGYLNGVPFFLLNLDRTYEGGIWANWPPMPRPISWSMTNILGAIHGKYWKFASCNAAGIPRELFAFEHLQRVEKEEL